MATNEKILTKCKGAWPGRSFLDPPVSPESREEVTIV